MFLKDLEAARPSAIIDIIHSGEAFEVREEVKKTQKVQRESILLQYISEAVLIFSESRNMSTLWVYVFKCLMQGLHSA